MKLDSSYPYIIIPLLFTLSINMHLLSPFFPIFSSSTFHPLHNLLEYRMPYLAEKRLRHMVLRLRWNPADRNRWSLNNHRRLLELPLPVQIANMRRPPKQNFLRRRIMSSLRKGHSPERSRADIISSPTGVGGNFFPDYYIVHQLKAGV